ncbi:MAG: YfiR family protein [Pirellulales bacterium]|nr:YfiR family protein [Pirellulales bacterium]
MKTIRCRRLQASLPPVRWKSRGLFRSALVTVFAAGALALPVHFASAQAAADVQLQQEYEVKAVFIYSFGRFVEWPPSVFASKHAPFRIGVLGKDPFGGALDQIARLRKIGDRRIVIDHFPSLSDYHPCQVLFVPKTTPPEEQMAAIKKLGTQPVLLVGEEPNFTQQGGTINFFLDQDSIRFSINAETVKRQHLSIDAKILQMAALSEGDNQVMK